MKSSVILFQSGNTSIDPKTDQEYDPWKSHIIDGLRQLRLWNPNIPIYFIVDGDVEPHIPVLDELRIDVVHAEDMDISRDMTYYAEYFSGERNHMWKTSFLRFFYIEKLMRLKNLSSVFTFDNDILIYSDLEKMSPCFDEFCGHTAITRVDQTAFVCGMMWIRDADSLSELNDIMLSFIKDPSNRRINECSLLHKAWLIGGDSLISSIPIWWCGSYSDNWEQYGGIFDPATIGQMIGGCHNGSMPGTIMIHHEIGPRMKKFIGSGGSIVRTMDNDHKSFYSFVDQQGNPICKINSIHMHNKNLKDYIDV